MLSAQEMNFRKGDSSVFISERRQQREPTATSFILFSLHIIINIIQPNIRYLLLLARAAAYVLKRTLLSLPLGKLDDRTKIVIVKTGPSTLIKLGVC